MTNSIQSLPFAEPLSSPQPKGQNHRSCAHLAHNRVPQSKRRSKHLKAKLLHLPHGDAPASRFEPSRHFLSLPVTSCHFMCMLIMLLLFAASPVLGASASAAAGSFALIPKAVLLE